jgi:U3 small nucleolar RNA-associated protein 18
VNLTRCCVIIRLGFLPVWYVAVPKLPIYNASFLGDTGKVVVSGRRSFFYFYDAVSGNVDLVPRILGREERSWEKHSASPDGRLVAFVGNDGYVVLVDAHSKHPIGTLKLNGSVRALAFTPDGEQIVASGSDGDVYRWDVQSRRCLERFPNGDGSITSSLSASSTHLAVGAESGVVNLYSERQQRLQQQSLLTYGSGGNSNPPTKAPLKSVMNLHTSADVVRFNPDGQILAMSSQRETLGLKLLHVPTRTVFSNWPTSKTPLRYVWSVDFSPKSKFLAVGNDKGQCLLYKLTHYHHQETTAGG